MVRLPSAVGGPRRAECQTKPENSALSSREPWVSPRNLWISRWTEREAVDSGGPRPHPFARLLRAAAEGNVADDRTTTCSRDRRGGARELRLGALATRAVRPAGRAGEPDAVPASQCAVFRGSEGLDPELGCQRRCAPGRGRGRLTPRFRETNPGRSMPAVHAAAAGGHCGGRLRCAGWAQGAVYKPGRVTPPRSGSTRPGGRRGRGC